MRHPRDPAAPHAAAAGFGRLLAAGLLDAGEVEAELQRSVALAVGVDRSGLRARLMHALGDSREYWTLRRDRATTRVHAAGAPLLAGGAPASAVLRAPRAAAGDDLEAGEAAALAAELAALMLRRSA
jgi:hypothetical protein